MPRYRVDMFQSTKETKKIEVEAFSASEAESIARKRWDDGEFDDSRMWEFLELDTESFEAEATEVPGE